MKNNTASSVSHCVRTSARGEPGGFLAATTWSSDSNFCEATGFSCLSAHNTRGMCRTHPAAVSMGILEYPCCASSGSTDVSRVTHALTRSPSSSATALSQVCVTAPMSSAHALPVIGALKHHGGRENDSRASARSSTYAPSSVASAAPTAPPSNAMPFKHVVTYCRARDNTCGSASSVTGARCRTNAACATDDDAAINSRHVSKFNATIASRTLATSFFSATLAGALTGNAPSVRLASCGTMSAAVEPPPVSQISTSSAPSAS
mmetsp:Transcript_4873/g.17682  ORF Transcript_4873/g.17682 Transcript_4873/m.17682 type:complete len:263 (-) Transcript_4873:768-1556(-)